MYGPYAFAFLAEAYGKSTFVGEFVRGTMEAMWKSIFLLFIAAILTACAIQPSLVSHEERYSNYSSAIEVDRAGGLKVTETISFVVEGEKIRHGIVRELMTHRKCGNSSRLQAPIKNLQIKRNGQKAAYFIKERLYMQDVYMGDKNVYLDPGEYSNTLSYEISSNISNVDERQILYRELTPIKKLKIDTVTSEIRLPEKTEVLEAYAQIRKKKEKLETREKREKI